MRTIALALIGSGLVFGSGCAISREVVLPDRTVPHKLAGDVQAEVWVRRADGVLVKQRVRLDAGYWCIAPEMVERPDGPTAAR